VDLKLTHTWAIARTQGTSLTTTVVVELRNGDGSVALGEAAPTARYNESVETVEGFLEKVDPGKLNFDDVAGSMSYINGLSNGDMSAKCALNIALLDGAARLKKKPIYDFL